MEYSENFNFALPSRDNDVDLADINEIANNFRKIDENAVKKEVGKGLSTNDFTKEYKEKLDSALLPENVDQNYNSKSKNAQSGVAVGEAVTEATKLMKFERTGNPLLIDDVSPTLHYLGIKTTPNKIVSLRGKNLIPFTNKKFNEGQSAGNTYNINGIDFTVNDDGSVTAVGTATSDAMFPLMVFPMVDNGIHTVTLSGSPIGASANTYCLRLTKGVTTVETYEDYGDGKTINGVNLSGCRVHIVVKSGVAVNTTFYPMLEFGENASEFVSPYTVYSAIADENGEINTLKSLYPYMSVYADEYIEIKCAYVCDLAKLFEKELGKLPDLQGKTLISGNEIIENPNVAETDDALLTALAIWELVWFVVENCEINTKNIANNAVTSTKIADKSVGFTKLNNIATTINENSRANFIPTAKAVYDYVESRLANLSVSSNGMPVTTQLDDVVASTQIESE